MTKKNSCVIFSVIGILFVMVCMAEHQLAMHGNIIWDGKWIVKLLAVGAAGGIPLGCLVCLGLLWIERKASKPEWNRKQGTQSVTKWPKPEWSREQVKQSVQKSWEREPHAGMVFLVAWVCTMLCWLPGFLAYYPGICAYDFTIQMGQISAGMYNEHHPLFHTLLMEGFIRLGDLFGSGTAGLALYVFVQMSVLAAALAGGVALLFKRGIGKGWLIGLQIFCCAFPYHWYMSISATKDTLFTAFVFLQLLMLCGLLEKQDSYEARKKCGETEGEASSGAEKKRREIEAEASSGAEKRCKEAKAESCRLSLWDWGYVLSSVGMILFRNNGRYAMLVLAGFFLLAVLFGKKARGLWAKLLVETVAGILVGSVMLSGVFRLTGAQQGDRREMLSMPIQQLARCMIYHGGVGVLPEDDDTMGAADKALINEFILNEAYRSYRPDISDPVKGNTNTHVVVHKVKDFVKTYIGLFVKYPGDYLNAVLAVNAGFLSPFDESHGYINVNGRDTGLGYIQTRWLDPDPNPYEIQRDSKWIGLHRRMEAFAEENQHMKLPVVKYLLVPGVYLWLYLVLAGWLLIHKKNRQLLPLALILGYYLTLFLGPTVQMRYLYPVMTCLPFLAVWLTGRPGRVREKAGGRKH